MGTPKFNKEAYDNVILRPHKGWKKPVQEAADRANMSLTKYLLEAVDEKMKRDNNRELAFPSTSDRKYRVSLANRIKTYHRETFTERNLLRTDDKGALRFIVDDDHTITIMSALDALEHTMNDIGDFITDVKSDDAKVLANEIIQNFFSRIIYAPSEGKTLSDMLYVKYTSPDNDPLIVISSDKRLIVQYLYNEVNLDNNEDWKIEETKGEEQ